MRGKCKLAAAVSGVLRAASCSLPLCAYAGGVALAAASQPKALGVPIPAEALSEALQALADQTGLQVVYVADVVRDRRSRAVAEGTLPGVALKRLLKGTGLGFEYLTPNSIRILQSPPSPATAADATVERPLQDVVVTANRRDQALQDVPITMEVLTGDALSRVNAETFDDVMAYLPAVTAHGVGPAQNNIYVRGLATGETRNQSAGANGVFPNVAIYLDEQSAQLPGRNLDVYAVDLERIEVLEGPQGTLFGAGAQAGVVRYLTNRPRLNATEGSVDASAAASARGAPGSAVSVVINLPLISDRLAVRGVIYNDRRGGYIDNRAATFARSDSDGSIRYANYPAGCGVQGQPACRVPPNSVVANNHALVGSDINPVTYSGLRIQALYRINDDWSVLLAQTYQNMEADGVFAEETADSLGMVQRELSAQLFNASYNKDRFENTALSVNGRVGTLQVLYAGSYLVRNIEQVQDYTQYARGSAYVDYYQCVNPGATAAAAQCFTPSSTWHEHERNTHLSQELRLSTPDNARIRSVGGLFYEDYRIYDQGDWFFLSALPYFHPVGPPTGYYTNAGIFVPHPATSNNPSVRPLGDGYFSDTGRGYAQKAAYVSVDFDLVPRVLTLTVGTRYFRTRDTEAGSAVGSFFCRTYDNPFAPVPDPCVDHSQLQNLDARGLDQSYSGFRSRANLTWKVSDEFLLYYTWSQGFRAGGFNRATSPVQKSPLYPGDAPSQSLARANGGWNTPAAYGPDQLINNEFGWKTRWLDRTLQWNGSIYQEDWQHAQIGALDPALLSGATLNGGNYRVRGIETSMVAQITGGLALEGGLAWNHTELVREAPFYWASGLPIDFRALNLPNPAGVVGSPLASPALRGNLRVRYEVNFDDYHAYAQLGAMHQSGSLSTTDQLGINVLGVFSAYHLPAFTTYDAALGVGRDAWRVQLNGENLTDERAQLYANYDQGYTAITISRPRTLSLSLSYRFGRAEAD